MLDYDVEVIFFAEKTMQRRQIDRALYFEELAVTCRKYYIPYISRCKTILTGSNILEIGCGDGGNLLPFFELGCRVTGVDVAACRIKDARKFFSERKASGSFILSDIFEFEPSGDKFDVIICHDVLEHIGQKKLFLIKLKTLLADSGILFVSFPAWQMPFGGHQQICQSKLLSHFPFIHLLPVILYKNLLRVCREDKNTIRELLAIKQTGCSIERFEKLILQVGCKVVSRKFYFVNPHYEVKFSLRPRKLFPFVGNLPYLRNFFITSCFYILKA